MVGVLFTDQTSLRKTLETFYDFFPERGQVSVFNRVSISTCGTGGADHMLLPMALVRRNDRPESNAPCLTSTKAVNNHRHEKGNDT